MSWLPKFLEAVIPITSVLLSTASIAIAWLTFKRTKENLAQVRAKTESHAKSPIVEDHAEMPGFNQKPDVDDADDAS